MLCLSQKQPEDFTIFVFCFSQKQPEVMKLIRERWAKLSEDEQKAYKGKASGSTRAPKGPPSS